MMDTFVDKYPYVSVITKIEILRFHTDTRHYTILENFISECNVLGLNDQIVDLTIAICKSRKIKLPDAIIAATAQTYDLTLVTRNTVDFKNVKGFETA